MKHSSQRDRELEDREVIRDFGVAPLAGGKPKPHYLVIYANESALADGQFWRRNCQSSLVMARDFASWRSPIPGLMRICPGATTP